MEPAALPAASRMSRPAGGCGSSGGRQVDGCAAATAVNNREKSDRRVLVHSHYPCCPAAREICLYFVSNRIEPAIGTLPDFRLGLICAQAAVAAQRANKRGNIRKSHNRLSLGEGTNDSDYTHNQRQGGDRRGRARHAVALGRARASQTHRHEIRLRRGPVRRLHRPYRRQGDALVPDRRLAGRRQEGHHHRGPVAERHASAAEGLDRRAGAAMRLLPVRPDHAGGGAARQQQEADARTDRRPHGRQHLPLRHLHAASSQPFNAQREA